VDDYFLVVGYGNTVRSDDGAGPRVAAVVEHLRLPGVRTIGCTQLTPELADPVAHARKVVFVDAAVGGAVAVGVQELDPSESSQILAHAVDPRVLLALARDAFGRAPGAWLVTVPGAEFGYGEELSPRARRGVDEAVRTVQALYGDQRRRGWAEPDRG
jgi:hydrogenase maturation protease